jgi:hypothetical protein
MRLSHRFRRGRLFRSATLAVAIAFLAASTACLAHFHKDLNTTQNAAAVCDLCAQLGSGAAAPVVVAFAAPPESLVVRTVPLVFQTPPVRRVVASLLPRGPPCADLS